MLIVQGTSSEPPHHLEGFETGGQAIVDLVLVQTTTGIALPADCLMLTSSQAIRLSASPDGQTSFRKCALNLHAHIAHEFANHAN